MRAQTYAYLYGTWQFISLVCIMPKALFPPGGSFYLVQEIVNGFGNLFDFLHKKNARLTYWQCAQIALGISDAMAYCE